MGFSNLMGGLNSIMAPLIAGWIVTDSVSMMDDDISLDPKFIIHHLQSDVTLWRIVFFLAAGYYLVGNTVFVLFGKGTVQPWNYSAVNTNGAAALEDAKKRDIENKQ